MRPNANPSAPSTSCAQKPTPIRARLGFVGDERRGLAGAAVGRGPVCRDGPRAAGTHPRASTFASLRLACRHMAHCLSLRRSNRASLHRPNSLALLRCSRVKDERHSMTSMVHRREGPCGHEADHGRTLTVLGPVAARHVFFGRQGPSVGRRARLSAGNVLSLGDDARGLRKGYG